MIDSYNFYLIYRNAKDIPVVVKKILGYSAEGDDYLRVLIEGEGVILFKKSRIDYFSSKDATGEITVIFDRRKSNDLLSRDFTGYKVVETGRLGITTRERTSWAD